MKITIVEGSKSIVIDTDEVMKREISVRLPVPAKVGRQKRKYVHTGKYHKKKMASKRFSSNHKFWTIEEKKKLLELSESGMKQRQIAKLFGRKTSAVRNALWISKHNPSWLAKAVNHRGRHKKA